MNALNQSIFALCSRRLPTDPEPAIYVTRSELRRALHGPALFRDLADRLACPALGDAQRLVFLVVTPMHAARIGVQPDVYARWLFGLLTGSAHRAASGQGWRA